MEYLFKFKLEVSYSINSVNNYYGYLYKVGDAFIGTITDMGKDSFNQGRLIHGIIDDSNEKIIFIDDEQFLKMSFYGHFMINEHIKTPKSQGIFKLPITEYKDVVSFPKSTLSLAEINPMFGDNEKFISMVTEAIFDRFKENKLALADATAFFKKYSDASRLLLSKFNG